MSKNMQYREISSLPEVIDCESDAGHKLMLDEAVARMEHLGLSETAISVFLESDGEEVWMSEGMGALYSIENNEGDDYALECLAKVREKEFLPYHVIHNMTNLGEMFSILVVSKYTEEWQMDRDDLGDGIVFADVYNRNYELDDLGSIRVRQVIGGLVREA